HRPSRRIHERAVNRHSSPAATSSRGPFPKAARANRLRTVRCVVAALAAVVLGGCSVAWVDTVAQPDPKAEPQCTSMNVAPVLDLAMAALGAGFTLAAVIEAR